MKNQLIAILLALTPIHAFARISMGQIIKDPNGVVRYATGVKQATQICEGRGMRLPTNYDFAIWATQHGGLVRESFADGFEHGATVNMTSSEFEMALKAEEDQNNKDGFLLVFTNSRGFQVIGSDGLSGAYTPRFYYDPRGFAKPAEEISLGIDNAVYFTSTKFAGNYYDFESRSNEGAFSLGEPTKALVRCVSP